jgi:hypothetical protein
MKILILVFLISSSSLIYAQKDTAKLFRPKQIIEDIDSLISGLQQIHPTFKKYYSENNLKNKIDSFKSTINQPIPSIDLFRFMQPIISIDGHTSLIFNDVINRKYEKRLIPFKLLIYEDRLYVKENLSSNKDIPQGAIIESINGVTAKELINNMIRYMPGEKMNFKIRRLGDQFHTFYWLVYGPYTEFKIKIKNSTIEYIVEATDNKQFNESPTPKFELIFYDDDIAYIYYRKFSPPKDFIHFIDSSFTIIKNKNIKFLIIDNTKNGGGLTDLGDTLTSYFTSKPYLSFEKKMTKVSTFTKNYIESKKSIGHFDGDYFVYEPSVVKPIERNNKFNGTTYILSSRSSYSAATAFPASAKCYKTAFIVGEETGQPLLSNGDINQFKLPNTQMNCISSAAIIFMACNNNDRVSGVMPDYLVIPTLDDLLNDKNYFLDYTLKLIRDNRNKKTK